MLFDVTVGNLSSLNYILVSLVFFHMFIIFDLCLWIDCIFLYFLPAYLSQDFCLGSVHYSSFFVGLVLPFYGCRLVFNLCEAHKFDTFSFDYIMLFDTNYSNLALYSFP